MLPSIIKAVSGTIIILASFSMAQAQTASDHSSQKLYWAHIAYGITSLGPGNTLGLGIDINRHIFSLRSSATDPAPFKDTWDVAFLYGRSIWLGDFYAAGSTGVGIVAGEQYSQFIGGTAEGSMDPMISFPVEGHLSKPLSRNFAVGLSAFFNVNTNQPFGGVSAAIRVGGLN